MTTRKTKSKEKTNTKAKIVRKGKAKTAKNRQVQEQTTESNKEEQQLGTGAFESDVETSSFYTSDKFFNKLDDTEIFNTLCEQYPQLQSEEDSIVKKTFIQLLNDESFVEQVLSYYNITIYDFFKLIYSQYSSIFKGPYLKKIKSELASKRYKIQSRRAHDY